MEQKLSTLGIEITTTGLCNLNCTYCFEGEKKEVAVVNLNNIKNIILNIVKLTETDFYKKNYNGILLTFWGGEPTLRHDVIVETFKILKKINKKDFLNIDFMIYSNGYELKYLENIISAAKKYKIEKRLQIQISYDGKLINDEYRLTYSKKETSNVVLHNFFYIAKELLFKGILTLKATIPVTAIKEDNLIKTWEEFYKLHEYLNSLKLKNKDIFIRYGPTIDYSKPLLFKVDENFYKKVLDNFKIQVEEIAKREYQFHQKYNKYLMSWFDSKDNRKFCEAGYKIFNINNDGKIGYCHGVIYIKNRDDLSINDLNFMELLNDNDINKIVDFLNYYKTNLNDYYKYEENDRCKNCEATYCAVCPAAIYDFNKEKKEYKDIKENLYINNKEFINCDFFKIFGKIDRSLKQILNLKN